MTYRHSLPNRRPAAVFDFVHQERNWTATVGHFEDGEVGEIFIDAGKESPLADAARETALVVSLALQFGCPLDVLRHALSGRDVSPIGAALALLDGQRLGSDIIPEG